MKHRVMSPQLYAIKKPNQNKQKQKNLVRMRFWAVCRNHAMLVVSHYISVWWHSHSICGSLTRYISTQPRGLQLVVFWKNVFLSLWGAFKAMLCFCCCCCCSLEFFSKKKMVFFFCFCFFFFSHRRFLTKMWRSLSFLRKYSESVIWDWVTNVFFFF